MSAMPFGGKASLSAVQGRGWALKPPGWHGHKHTSPGCLGAPCVCQPPEPLSWNLDLGWEGSLQKEPIRMHVPHRGGRPAALPRTSQRLSVHRRLAWGSGPAGRHVSFPVHTVGQEQNPDHSHSPCAVGSHGC